MVEFKNKPMKDQAKLKQRLPALPLDLNLAVAIQLLSGDARLVPNPAGFSGDTHDCKRDQRPLG